MNNSIIKRGLLPVLAVGTVGGFSAARAQTAPTVTVNGQAVQFVGQPPVEQGGRVLVPLRGVLEKLGAYVQFDAPTRTITAYRGATRIMLPVGSRQAMVNNRAVALDAPAQVLNGSTLVPLRFVAESLGAQVNFNYQTQTVAINMTGTTPGRNGSTSPAVLDPPKADETVVSGVIVSVFSDTAPRRIVVRVPDPNRPKVAAEERTIPLNDNARVQQRRLYLSPLTIALNRVHVGDTVEIRQAPNGTANAVIITRRAARPARNGNNTPPAVPGNANATDTFKGEFLDFTKSGSKYILKMTDGRLIEVQDDVPTFYDGQKIDVGDLRSGDQLTISVNPRTKSGTRIVVAPEQ